jgi:hypothetical protein
MRWLNFKTIAIVTIAAAGVIVSVIVHHRAEAGIRENNDALIRQHNQLAELAAEHGRLSKRTPEAMSDPKDGARLELERLRAEAASLRGRTNQLEEKLARSRGARKLLGFPSTPPGNNYTPEDYAQRKEMAAGKESDASILSRAFYDYYRTHQGQFPSSMDQLAPFLAENQLSLTGTNQFDLIYPGPQDGLTNFPTQMLAVIREQQPWLAPSGRWARVYGMLTIPPRIVETDDNFQSWESEHVIPPVPPSSR